jgi:hypothetical protein
MMQDTGGNDHYVVESRQHFEQNNEPASWGFTRFWWSQTMDQLFRWLTSGLFADGRYRLRLKSWQLSGSKLGTWEILPLCNTTDPNGAVIYLDNRVVTSGPTNANGQPCGSGTIHTCTTEPDTDIVSVKIIHPDSSETDVAACGNVPVSPLDKLQIDFVAYDPDGHLADVTLTAHYDEDKVKNVFATGSITPLGPSPVPWAPPAVQPGPTYSLAQTQGAIPPVWHGGAMRFTVDPAIHPGGIISVFPYTCCYLLRLVARKRTIVNCDDDQWTHVNISERSFMIQV